VTPWAEASGRICRRGRALGRQSRRQRASLPSDTILPGSGTNRPVLAARRQRGGQAGVPAGGPRRLGQ